MDLPFEEAETVVSSVLVADDEPSVRQLLGRLLGREADLSVSVVESAEAALLLLAERRFDLLVSDKNLPGKGGIELIEEARKLRPGIEAIMITGYASAESVIAAFAAGASDYLVKPFEQVSVVKAKVHAALDRRRERVRASAESNRIAREASKLLQAGKVGTDPTWKRLEAQLAAYEKAIRAGTWGVVFVVGQGAALAQLKAAGVEASPAGADDPRLALADVVVVDTGMPQWRELVDRLMPAKPDMVLTAVAGHDLGDLLEAISLKLDLVGLNIPGLLTTRVRELLMRQAVRQSKQALVAALDEFRAALGGG